MKRFITSSIGISIIGAIFIIGIAVFIKTNTQKPKEDLRQKIDLIAQKSVQKAIETGKLSTNDWEDTLKLVMGTSTLDEKIENLQASVDSSQGIPEGKLSATERFSRELLEKYVDFKDRGGTIDEETSIRLANELIMQDYGGPTKEMFYTEKDIIVLNTKNITDLQKYSNQLEQAFDQTVSDRYEHEMLLITKMYEQNDSSYLSNLPENLKRYEQMLADLLAIPVPFPLKEAHIALLNSISAFIEGVQGMLLIESDPIAAARMILRYEEGVNSIEPILLVIENYLKNQKVTFSSDTGGYIFYR